MTVDMVGAALDVGVVVRDMDRMLAFYREHLGFPETGRVDAGEVTVRFLRAGNSTLKLLQHASAPASANPRGGANGATGLRYLTIHVASVAAALRGIEATGATVVDPHIEFDASLVALIEDPEGNALELVEQIRSS